MERKSETKLVKQVLSGLGIVGASVGHGRGTGWGWLDITLPKVTTPHKCIDSRISGPQPVQHLTREQMGENAIYFRCCDDCPACREWSERNRNVITAVQAATGRSGDYNGRITIQST